MEYIYREGHDKRFSHIPKEFRHLYPDAIKRGSGHAPIERKYTLAELRQGIPLKDKNGSDLLDKEGNVQLVRYGAGVWLHAKDVSIKDIPPFICY